MSGAIQRKNWNRPFLHRGRWQQHPNAQKTNNLNYLHRYDFQLKSDRLGPKGCYIGVLMLQEGCDLSEADSFASIERFSSFKNKFQREQIWAESWWPWCENLDEETVD